MIEGTPNNSKRIYILGAGSSIGHSQGSFPTITRFFTAAKKLGYDSNNEFVEIGKYVQEAFGHNIESKPAPVNIEDLFTHIEIEIERKTSPELLGIRQNLLKLIQNVLIESEKQVSGNGEYDDFHKILKNNDTIITFNWDLLLDNVLGRANAIEKAKSIAAGEQGNQYNQFVEKLSVYGEWSRGHSVMEPYSTWPTDTGYYLKLHGSIDWFYCSNESCRGYNKVFPLLDPVTDCYCAECHEPLISLLIPPILNKGYRQYPLIRRIWNIAAQEIRSADEIIVWGYSLPPTDFYSSWLIRQGREAPLKKLLIINPEVVTRTEKLRYDFINRFRDFFADKNDTLSLLLYESFDDYCNDNDLQKKYGLTIPERKIRTFDK